MTQDPNETRISGGFDEDPIIEPVEEKNNNRTIIIAVAAVVVLCCCCVAVSSAFWLYNNGDALFF